jgi:hypothetical protein
VRRAVAVPPWLMERIVAAIPLRRRQARPCAVPMQTIVRARVPAYGRQHQHRRIVPALRIIARAPHRVHARSPSTAEPVRRMLLRRRSRHVRQSVLRVMMERGVQHPVPTPRAVIRARHPASVL